MVHPTGMVAYAGVLYVADQKLGTHLVHTPYPLNTTSMNNNLLTQHYDNHLNLPHTFQDLF